MKPFLIVVPENGLCNRIRCLAGARSFANDYDYWMVVLWTKTTDCKIKFQDLFCGFPAVIININWKHVPTKLVNFVAMLFRCIVVDGSNENVSIDKCYWNEIRNRNNLLIRSCFNLYDKSKIKSDYSLFKVKESLINKSNIEPCEIGIHIRRTDHGWSKFFSPTELFEDAIDSEFKKNSSIKFL